MAGEKELIIYGKSECPQCDTLLHKLNEFELDFTYLTLDLNYKREELMDIKPVSVRTFPVSFIKYNGDITYIKNDDIHEDILT